MIKNTDKKYKIQLSISNNTLTYSSCSILDEDEAWLTFSDTYNNIYKVNKNCVVIMQELK